MTEDQKVLVEIHSNGRAASKVAKGGTTAIFCRARDGNCGIWLPVGLNKPEAIPDSIRVIKHCGEYGTSIVFLVAKTSLDVVLDYLASDSQIQIIDKRL